MVQPRRAKPRPRPTKPVAALIAALALVVGLLVWQPWGDDGQVAAPGPTDAPTASSSAPAATATPGSTSQSGAAAARLVLQECMTSVEAADLVVTRAKTGVGHWNEHVQAQTDSDAGLISVTQRQAIFSRTRLAGPEDVSAYTKAARAYASVEDPCSDADVSGEEGKVADQLADCKTRDAALATAMTAADAAMTDWTEHLAAMKRSAGGHVHNAQDIWIAAWKAAPPHIAAFEKAERAAKKAPAC